MTLPPAGTCSETRDGFQEYETVAPGTYSPPVYVPPLTVSGASAAADAAADVRAMDAVATAAMRVIMSAGGSFRQTRQAVLNAPEPYRADGTGACTPARAVRR